MTNLLKPHYLLTESELSEKLRWGDVKVYSGGATFIENKTQGPTFSSNSVSDVNQRPVLEYDLSNNKYNTQKVVNILIDQRFDEFLTTVFDRASLVVHDKSHLIYDEKRDLSELKRLMYDPRKSSKRGTSCKLKIPASTCGVFFEDKTKGGLKDLIRGRPCTLAIRVGPIWFHEDKWGVSLEIKRVILHDVLSPIATREAQEDAFDFF